MSNFYIAKNRLDSMERMIDECDATDPLQLKAMLTEFAARHGINITRARHYYKKALAQREAPRTNILAGRKRRTIPLRTGSRVVALVMFNGQIATPIVGQCVITRNGEALVTGENGTVLISTVPNVTPSE